MHKRFWQINTLRAKTILGPVAALALVSCGAEPAVEEASAAADETSAAPFEEGAMPVPVMGDEVRIVAFGDSLFAGYNLPEPDGYPEKLEGALRARGINARVIDAGVSGDTSAAGRDRLAFTLEAQESAPDLFVLELGGNDLLRGISPEETRANFEAMLTTLREAGVPVLIMGMRSPPNYGPEYQAAFDTIYADMAEQYDAGLIDFWLEDIYTRPELFQNDRIHPTAEGIEALVASTLDEVAGALPEEPEQ